MDTGPGGGNVSELAEYAQTVPAIDRDLEDCELCSQHHTFYFAARAHFYQLPGFISQSATSE